MLAISFVTQDAIGNIVRLYTSCPSNLLQLDADNNKLDVFVESDIYKT